MKIRVDDGDCSVKIYLSHTKERKDVKGSGRPSSECNSLGKQRGKKNGGSIRKGLTTDVADRRKNRKNTISCGHARGNKRQEVKGAPGCGVVGRGVGEY